MKTLLRIDASASPADSVSQQLADDFVARWLQNEPNGKVIQRDLNQQTPEHLSPEMLGALFASEPTAAQKHLFQFADELITEIEAADMLLISTPMYNFGIPSTLKAYFDHIARAGRTFQYTENGPEGLLIRKSAVAIISSGGDYRQPPLNQMNFVDGYLQTFLGFIGIQDVHLMHAAGLAMEGRAELAVAEAQQKIVEYFAETAAA